MSNPQESDDASVLDSSCLQLPQLAVVCSDAVVAEPATAIVEERQSHRRLMIGGTVGDRHRSSSNNRGVIGGRERSGGRHAEARSSKVHGGSHGSRRKSSLSRTNRQLGTVSGSRIGCTEPTKGRHKTSSMQGLMDSRRGDLGVAGSAVLGRAPVALRPTMGSRARTSSSGSRTRTRVRLPSHRIADASTQSANHPSENNCYAWCLARVIDVTRLEAAWMETLQQRAFSRRSKQEGQSVPNEGTDSIPRNQAQAAPRVEALNVARDVVLVPLNEEVKLLKIGRRDCFIFPFGCLVCWRCKAETATRALDAIRPFLVGPLAPHNIDEDHIDITNPDRVKIDLSSRDPPTFERVAVAYALAQSVRLGTLELRVDRSIVKTRSIPESLAKEGYVSSWSIKQATQMVGEMFSLKHDIQLKTDIIDTPDFFWNYGDYERTYQTCREHLDIDPRVSVLNARIEIVQELVACLEEELTDRHTTRLEWLCIVLVASEALVAGIRNYLRAMNRQSGSDGDSAAAGAALALSAAYDSSHRHLWEVTMEPPNVVVMPIFWLLYWVYRLFVQWPLTALSGGLSAAASAAVSIMEFNGSNTTSTLVF
eukprot:TRINITY_DN38737_c0_g1_i1.p1 TRINITY_DN38737_c0_g1~~TRINITY_DN38737_c0_g1_i1.p1  ORF type:complete len:594 (+),score=78.91 TRINITY_DN38737_c0_g1_i1:168-1949(+)